MSTESLAKSIKGIIFDVDGVLTDGRIIYNDAGVETKQFHVRDGASIKLLASKGIVLAIITGRQSSMVTRRAEELGILRADPGIRKLLARSAINTVVRESQALLIKEPQLIAFYNNHQAVFQKPQRITLQAAQFDDLEMANISRNAVLLGDSLKKTVSLVGGKILPIPVSPLPKHMLIRYLGISLTDLALGLSATQISQPILQGDNIYLLHVVENQPATLMPFEQVRETVMTELISRQRRDSLTMTLEELKQTASIQLNLSLLGQLASTDK